MPLLLHSLATFDALLREVLMTTGARSIAEVGAEGGQLSELLVDVVGEGGQVTCVDPAPSDHLIDLADRASSLTLVRELSQGVLPELPEHDAYVLDGDHNYVTVHGELTALVERVTDLERPALLVLHDVAWPNARRDMYYDPTALPADDVHPHSYEGRLVPNEPGLSENGFWGAGISAVALREGGPRNGVLTAVEDVLAGLDDVRFRRVPCVFGVGFVYASSAPWADALDAVLAPYDENPLLAALEANRLELYVEVLRLQDEVLSERRARVLERAHAERELARFEELRAEAAAQGRAVGDWAADIAPSPS